jgi:DNA-binding MarR family transcriptional regulator
MPFHDQPGLPQAAQLRAAENRRARNRLNTARAISRLPDGGNVDAIVVNTEPWLGRTTVETALRGLLADNLITRTRTSSGPARTWHYRLTATGMTYATRTPEQAYADSRLPGKRAQAARQRATTRAAILATLGESPNARTVRYIANHIGMSTSAVRRALATLTDTGEVLTTPHPFLRRQRLYSLPCRTTM